MSDASALAHDFFFELMRESQRVRAVWLAERERWVRGLEISGREEILFELEMLLGGLDRFFIVRNLFGDEGPPPEREFREELKSVRDAVHRAILLSRRLIAPTQEQALVFRSYVESSLADERARSRLGAELREQRTPEESLFILRAGLSAYQGILDHLLELGILPQPLFLDLGRALRHELFVSRYFCPPAALEFRAEYDRVGSIRLLEGLRALPDEKRRKAFALALLAAFRALRSLRYVPAPPVPHTRRVLVILALVRSELLALAGFLETDLPRLCATVEGVGNAALIGRSAAQPLREGLAQVPPILAAPLTDRAQLDGQRDHLVAATKGAIAALARAIGPAAAPGAELFEEAARAEQSERLRRDLWIFRRLCLSTAEALDQPGASLADAEPLRRYAEGFRDVGYQLLRHSDRELFDRFLDLLELWATRRDDPVAVRLQRLRDDCTRFADVLGRALEQVGRRLELNSIPQDDAAYQSALAAALAAR